jgi:two-component system cell cycle response regulator DivK
MNGTRILLVDDYRDSLEVWEWYLRSLGYEVATATNGLDAVRLAETSHPHVIVMDLELPGITGYEAARRLQGSETTARIPLIAATGYSHRQQLDQARDAGFKRIVIKPCDPARLVSEIEAALTEWQLGSVAAEGK